MRASRGWSLLVLVVVLGLLGPPAAASADDAGLRAVVQRDLAVEKRLVAAEGRLKAPSSRSFPALVRYLRRVSNHYARVERSVEGLQRSYRAQAPETAEATQGRTLLLSGHREIGRGAHATVVAIGRGIRQMSDARTEAGYDRAGRRMIRVLNAQDARFRRGNSRVGRGRALVQEAPVPTAPTPVPVPTPPAPAPATPGPSAPAPLLPSVLGSLLGV